MGKFKGILFDMDGTLLPMNQDHFMKVYFKELAGVLTPLGIEAEPLIAAVWAGTKAMVKNDGQRLNKDVFWTSFAQSTGQDSEIYRPVADVFYKNQFHNVKAATTENPRALRAVELAREKAEKVILATNPLFPMDGQESRLSWMGLKPADFDLVTSYENSRFCKPNPAYYLEICEKMDLDPAACLMIGNDDTEDMFAARAVGMETYLVTDCRIPGREQVWEGPMGSFAEMLAMLESL